jgi:hypothetical protein
MGQSTSVSSGNARNQNVADEFQDLLELVGDWVVDEFVFRTQTAAQHAEPIVNIGRVTCRTAIGRLAIVVVTDIASSLEQTITLNTFDPRQNRYELALVDSNSDTGIVLFAGQTLNTRASEEIRAQFGKAAIAVREWTIASGQQAGQVGIEFDRIVENKISDDRWVIQYFGGRAQHGEALVKQQVLTRSNVGCQPQLGCELGCPGLMGCQEGCQGLQGPQALQGQAQLGCACQSQTLGQGQMLAQPAMLAQPPVVIPPVLITPPVLLPQLGAGTTPLATQLPLFGLAQPVLVVAQPTCLRQPVRPPRLRGEHHGK